MFEKQTEIAQDVLALSQAKGVDEDVLWKMPIQEFYSTIASFSKYQEKYNKKTEEI